MFQARFSPSIILGMVSLALGRIVCAFTKQKTSETPFRLGSGSHAPYVVFRAPSLALLLGCVFSRFLSLMLPFAFVAALELSLTLALGI